MDVDNFDQYIEQIQDKDKRQRTKEVLQWVEKRFPELDKRIAWSQPMFTKGGSFIIGFSLAKGHLAVTPEAAGIEAFSEKIHQAGYTSGSMLFRINWEDPVNYPLLEEMILFNLEDKKDCKSFWRK